MNFKKVITAPIVATLFTCALAATTVSAGEYEGEFETELEDGYIKHEMEFTVAPGIYETVIELKNIQISDASILTTVSCSHVPSAISPVPTIETTVTPANPNVHVKCEFEAEEQELEMKVSYLATTFPDLNSNLKVSHFVNQTDIYEVITNQAVHRIGHSDNGFTFPYEMESEWKQAGALSTEPAPPTGGGLD